MEKTKSILFYELCRLCLGDPGSNDVFNSTDLARDILICTGVKVSPSDNLPCKICTKCFEIIIKAKYLRILALKNDTDLRSLFEDNNDKRNEPDNVEDISSSSYPANIENVNNENNEYNEKEKHIRKLSFDSHNTSTPEKRIKIKVREDLFETSSTVTSSTIEKKETCTDEKKNMPVKCKRKRADSEETEYECEICNKSFDKWKQLYLHQRSHNKTLMCPLDGCSKKFASKGDLEKHLRVHTGVKPYQCDLCDKSFTQNVTLKSHRESIHHVHYK